MISSLLNLFQPSAQTPCQSVSEMLPTALETGGATPVTWHVAMWVLLSLAITSMAQPSGKIASFPRRYRVYLASSPIICMADTVSIIVRLITTMFCFQIGIKKASQLILLLNFECPEANALETPSSAAESSQSSRTSPRWIFYALGTLPAVIKLASLTGLPWTQTWGMMFVSSFIVTEFVTVLSRSKLTSHGIAIESYLGLTLIEEQEPQYQDLRSNATLIARRLNLFDNIISALALLTHFGLFIWAVEVVWLQAIEQRNVSNAIRWIGTWYPLTLVLLVLLAVLLWQAFWCLGFSRGVRFLSRILVWIFKAAAISITSVCQNS